MQPKNCDPLHCKNFCGEIFPFECVNFSSSFSLFSFDVSCSRYSHQKIEYDKKDDFFKD